MQNVPKGVCREIFVPDEGCVFVGGDLAQAENRVVAYLTRDENMIKVVNSEHGDVHTENAAKIFDKKAEQITKNERQLGKRITHGCLLPEAEVLTPEGWVRFDELEEGMEVAQYDLQSGEITYAVPLIHKYDYDGVMYAADGNGHKNVYSPEHRIPYVKKKKYQWGERDHIWKTVEELSQYNRPGMMPVSGRINSNREINLHPDDARVLVMVQADGNVEKYGGVRFSFKKERKKQRCKELLERVGIPFNIQKHKVEGYERIYIEAKHAKPIVNYLGKDKVFGNWILHLPQETLSAVIEEVQYWDGSRSHDTSWLYDTTNHQNAVAIQTVAHLCGHAATLQTINNNTVEGSYGYSKDTKLLYRVSIMPKTHVGIRNEHWSRHYHQGKIYCLSVPTEAFLVRYNNSIHVTMNSNYKMGPITFARYAELPTNQAKQMLQLYYDTYPRLKMWHKEIERKIKRDRTLTNPFGRRRVFAGRLEDGLFRDATAYLPQSAVADAIHRSTLQIYARLPWPATIAMQLHDSLTAQCPEEMADEVKEIMREELERPFKINGQEVSIPADIDVGYTWNEVG